MSRVARGKVDEVRRRAALLVLGGGALHAQRLADLMATARPIGEVPAFENDYVRVSYALLEYPPAERRVAESRPVVLYLRVKAEGRLVNTRLLDPPRASRPLWQPGVVPRGVHIEVLKWPPAPPAPR